MNIRRLFHGMLPGEAAGLRSFEGLRDESTAALTSLFAIMFPAGAVLGGIAAIISVYLCLLFGGYCLAALHTCMYLAAAGIIVFRRRLPPAFPFCAMLVLITVDIVQSLLAMGIAGTGMMNLVILCIFAGIFAGKRAGVIAIGAGTFGVSLIGLLMCTGYLPIGINITEYLLHPAAWAIQIVCFLLFVFPIVLAVNRMQEKMLRSLGDFRKVNERLQTEVWMRKKIEDNLREIEDKYRSVVQSGFVGFCIIQNDLFEFVNDEFCRMTGRTREELIGGMDPLTLIHEDERGQAREILAAFQDVSCEERNREYGLRVVRKDGAIVPIKVIVGVLVYRGRRAAVSTLIDVTNERALESQLRQAQKMEAIGNLAGGIAHDFNNYLSALIGYGNLLQRSIEEESPLRQYADKIVLTSMKTKDLTQKLLTLGRRDHGGFRIVDVNDHIRGTADLLTWLTAGNIDHVVELTRASTVTMADSIQLDRILLNLAANARDAMPDGGTMTVRTEVLEIDDNFIDSHGFGRAGEYVMIQVSDTGFGMDEKTKERIFDPFFTTKEEGKGTGLGLSTVYGIVKQHRGYIDVESERDRGTVFRVYLPAASSSVGSAVSPMNPLSVIPRRRS